jgi:hypothetical protein
MNGNYGSDSEVSPQIIFSSQYDRGALLKQHWGRTTIITSQTDVDAAMISVQLNDALRLIRLCLPET